MKPINVIFNPNHPEPDRLDRLLAELTRQGLDADKVDIWPCIRGRETVEASINASHKMLVRMARELGLPEIAIMEEDVHFPAPDGYSYWMENLPAGDWDIYFAGTYDSRVGDRVPRPRGMHAYIIRSWFYDKFLAVDPTEHIDQALRDLGDFRVCYPYAAIQRPGWSVNKREEVDYNKPLAPEDVYRGVDPDFYTTPEFD
jgi:hypothetical protein